MKTAVAECATAVVLEVVKVLLLSHHSLDRALYLLAGHPDHGLSVFDGPAVVDLRIANEVFAYGLCGDVGHLILL